MAKTRPIICWQWDEVRYSHMSVYGYKRRTTPNSEQTIAKDGVVFDRCVSSSSLTPVCTPAMWTGLSPNLNGCRDPYGYIRNKLLWGYLKEKGYVTGGFVSNGLLSEMHGFHQGLDVFSTPKAGDDIWDTLDALWRRKFDLPNPGTPEMAGNWYEDEVIDFMKKNKDKNFFIWNQFYETHSGSEGWLIKKKKKIQEGHWPEGGYYDAKIECGDKVFGRWMDTLKDLGLYDDAIILMTSDHGTDISDDPDSGLEFVYRIDTILPPGIPTHPSFYEWDVHVPLIIKGPKGGSFTGGKRIGGMVRHIDMVPTILQLAGFSPEEINKFNLEGISLAPFLDAGQTKIRGLTGYIDEMWELRPQGAKQALTTEFWKYIRYLTGMNEEFFELQTDPKETANVIESVKTNAPQFLKQLRIRCNEALWKTGRAVAMDEKEKAIVDARLRGLGYTR
jgi:arylsulfatase A-like enzyme